MLTFESQLLQESNCRNIKKQQASKEDFPSAPPFSCSFGEIKQDKEHSPLPKANYMSSTGDSVDFLAKSTVEKKIHVVDLKPINKQETSNPSRFDSTSSIFANYIATLCNFP